VVTKQAEPEPAVPGQDTITYTVVVSNPGPSSITGVTLTDDFPAEVDSPTWTCTGVACPSGNGSGHLNETLNLPENSVVTYTITGTVAPSATSLVNTASVNNPAYETNPGDNSATVTTTLTPETDLSISKSSERAGLAGTPITYTIVVRNAGPSDAYGATVSDSVPAGVSGFTWSCTASGGATCSGSGSGDINDTVNVPVGGVVTYTGNGTVTTDDPIINTASVDAPAGATDPTPDDDQVTDHSGGRLFLPMIIKAFVSAPDLVVDSLVATSNDVTVTIRNQGSVAVPDAEAYEFWVDLYINPSHKPGYNETCQTMGCEGAAWGITSSATSPQTLLLIEPGEVFTLTTGGDYYWWSKETINWPLTPGDTVYAQVDSSNAVTTYGAVRENHEITGGPYNNVSDEFTVQGFGATSPPVLSLDEGPEQDISKTSLPERP
jgi:uncharacterized repeat protein (TIGR01451 family)